MMIMCLRRRRCSSAKPAAAIFMPPSKSGMSPIVMRSIRASIICRLGPTRIMPPLRLAPEPLVGAVPLDQAAVVARRRAS